LIFSLKLVAHVFQANSNNAAMQRENGNASVWRDIDGATGVRF